MVSSFSFMSELPPQCGHDLLVHFRQCKQRGFKSYSIGGGPGKSHCITSSGKTSHERPCTPPRCSAPWDAHTPPSPCAQGTDCPLSPGAGERLRHRQKPHTDGITDLHRRSPFSLRRSRSRPACGSAKPLSVRCRPSKFSGRHPCRSACIPCSAPPW